MLRPESIGKPRPEPADRRVRNDLKEYEIKTKASVRTEIVVDEMDCPTEETLIRKKLAGMPGVGSVEFNLLRRVLTVEHDANALASVLDALRALGFTPRTEPRNDAPAGKRAVWMLAFACVAAAASEAASGFGGPSWLVVALALAAIASCGFSTYRKGFIAISNGNLNINALMSIAVTGAMVIGQWPEAAMVMALFTIAELIEAKSLQRARNAIAGLMKLAPDTATVLQADGLWRAMEASAVTRGAVVRVRPGERIALDGVVTSGRSAVNQAPITGESLPVEKSPGDDVFAGTVNETGSFEFRVSAAAKDTTLARIIRAIESAQGAKAPTQRFVDRFARIYTPLVLLVAIAVAVVPPLAFDELWYAWIYRALVLLVIACPCALVISTPVTIVSGLAAAARHGILVKGGTFLERGRRLRWLAFDKTGTITHGKPVQTHFALLDRSMDEGRVRAIAASLAGRSDHPVSLAIAQAASQDGGPRIAVEAFEAVPGRGVRGVVEGRVYWLGNQRMMEDIGRGASHAKRRAEALEREGRTVVMLADADNVLGLFAVADTVKESSRDAIARLHALGVQTAMLSGDNPHTARAIASAVGIDRVEAGQLPEDKLRTIESLGADGSAVGMAGDGINDAPALARADIGFAMGAMGTDTAIETADVALMDDDLRKIAAFIRLSSATHAILVQNIAFALVVKGVFLALAVAGLGSMWMAVFADVGASLLVVGNGLRILHKRFN